MHAQNESSGHAQRRILLITGTPGVGKHAVAGAISDTARPRWDVVDTSQVARRAGLHSEGYDSSDDTADVDAGELTREIEMETGWSGGGGSGGSKMARNCIVVGHLAPYAVPRDDVVMAVILRRNPHDLMRVYEDRRYSEKKARENAGAEMLGVIEHDTFAASYIRTVQFDTTGKKAPEVARAILDVLSAAYPGDDYWQDPCAIPEKYGTTQGSIDWVSKLGGRGSAAEEQSRVLGEIMPGWPSLQDT